MSTIIKILNNTLELLPQKAAYWHEEEILLISDLHIGKISHFRKSGIPVPAEALNKNFDRLDYLMENIQPRKLLFIGDLFHSEINKEWDQFCEWRSGHRSIPMEIVLGNHDRLAMECYDDAFLSIHKEETSLFPFTFSHHPRKKFKTKEFVICGHVHPVIVLEGRANERLRLPCFFFSEQQCILPSFGYFTGGYEIEPYEGDKVVAVANGRVIEVR
jgi:DNA ligase-associated metallophosphoesterase